MELLGGIFMGRILGLGLGLDKCAMQMVGISENSLGLISDLLVRRRVFDAAGSLDPWVSSG
eukprot:146404-Pyramimonas_sp.AAC.1